MKPAVSVHFARVAEELLLDAEVSTHTVPALDAFRLCLFGLNSLGKFLCSRRWLLPAAVASCLSLCTRTPAAPACRGCSACHHEQPACLHSRDCTPSVETALIGRLHARVILCLESPRSRHLQLLASFAFAVGFRPQISRWVKMDRNCRHCRHTCFSSG